MTRLNRRQTGSGWIGFLYLLATLTVLGLVAMYSIPVYMTAYSVDEALQAVAHNPDFRDASKRELHKSIAKQLRVNYAESVPTDNFTIEKIADGRRLRLEYSVNRHLMFNVGLRYHFDKSAVLPSNETK